MSEISFDVSSAERRIAGGAYCVEEERGTAVTHFVVVYLGQRAKLEVIGFHVLKAAAGIFGIPDFR